MTTSASTTVAFGEEAARARAARRLLLGLGQTGTRPLPVVLGADLIALLVVVDHDRFT